MNLRRLAGIAILVLASEAHVSCAQEETAPQDRANQESTPDNKALAEPQKAIELNSNWSALIRSIGFVFGSRNAL